MMPTRLDESLATPSIATKFLVPSTPRYLILRSRLLDILDRGAEGRLMLLSAPPGAGKTVLLASWVATRELPGPACWVTLDADDNDVSRLLADLSRALRGSGAVEEGRVLDRLPPPSGARADRFLPLLVNRLAELRSPVSPALAEIHAPWTPQTQQGSSRTSAEPIARCLITSWRRGSRASRTTSTHSCCAPASWTRSVLRWPTPSRDRTQVPALSQRSSTREPRSNLSSKPA